MRVNLIIVGPHEMPPRPPHRRLTRPLRHRAVQELLKGRSLREVARGLGVQEEQLRLRTMAQVSRRLGVKPVAWLFLSHAHEDSALARSLAELLEAALGGRIHVFCTSSARDRIGSTSASELLSAQELEEALGNRIEAALGVLLLVTPRAVRKDSRWIEYEIATGVRMARSMPQEFTVDASQNQSGQGRRFYLIPCVCADRHLVSEWDQKLWKSIFKKELSRLSSSKVILPGARAPSLSMFQYALLSTDRAANAKKLWRLTELLAEAADLPVHDIALAWWERGAHTVRLAEVSKLVAEAL